MCNFVVYLFPNIYKMQYYVNKNIFIKCVGIIK